MSDEKEHVVKFEQDDYYGPNMKLELDCSNPGAVIFKIEGHISGISSELDYSLYMPDEVEKVIAELTAWCKRDRERTRR